VLVVDAGAVLGGLVGAGAASPLLVAGPATPAKQRAWASIAAGTALVGGVTAAIVVRPRPGTKASAEDGVPMLGVIGESRVGARSAPILGVGWSGALRW